MRGPPIPKNFAPVRARKAVASRAAYMSLDASPAEIKIFFSVMGNTSAAVFRGVDGANHRREGDAKILTHHPAPEPPIPVLCTEADKVGSKFRAAREAPDAIPVRGGGLCEKQECGEHAE